jgi:hypothetical protein
VHGCQGRPREKHASETREEHNPRIPSRSESPMFPLILNSFYLSANDSLKPLFTFSMPLFVSFIVFSPHPCSTTRYEYSIFYGLVGIDCCSASTGFHDVSTCGISSRANVCHPFWQLFLCICVLTMRLLPFHFCSPRNAHHCRDQISCQGYHHTFKCLATVNPTRHEEGQDLECDESKRTQYRTRDV